MVALWWSGRCNASSITMYIMEPTAVERVRAPGMARMDVVGWQVGSHENHTDGVVLLT